MTTAMGRAGLSVIKAYQQRTWASGDYAVVAARIVLASELLADAADLKAGWQVLDFACGNGDATIPLVHRHLHTTTAPSRRQPAPPTGRHTRDHDPASNPANIPAPTQPNPSPHSNQETGNEKDQDRRRRAGIVVSSASGAPERFPRVL